MRSHNIYVGYFYPKTSKLVKNLIPFLLSSSSSFFSSFFLYSCISLIGREPTFLVRMCQHPSFFLFSSRFFSSFFLSVGSFGCCVFVGGISRNAYWLNMIFCFKFQCFVPAFVFLTPFLEIFIFINFLLCLLSFLFLSY